MSAGRSRRLALLLACVLVLLLAACKNEPIPTPASTGSGSFDVDPVFREFYENVLGGYATMGGAINPAFEHDGLIEQYTVGGLMRYDRLAPTAQQFTLAPLGRDLNIQNPALDFPDQEGLPVENGVIIFPRFLDTFEHFGRTRFAGQPISQVRVEEDKARIVQYFENIGLYTSSSDPSDGVHLLAYGAAACKDCTFDRQQRNDIPASAPTYDQPFLPLLSRLGTDFVSAPLSQPYRAPDGMIEQVYEHFIVYSSAENMKSIRLRPLPELTGTPPGSLAIRVVADGLVFKPLGDGLGHNVAVVFDQYVALHGGMDLSGLPTTEIFAVGAIYRQCFTAYCLDFDPAAPEGQHIRPAKLGFEYLNRFPPEAPGTAALTLSAERLHVLVWEENSLIPSSQAQTVFLKVLQRSDQTPIPNLGATLTVTLPDGRQTSYDLPATDESGLSSVQIAPIPAENGTLIPYRICLATGTGPQVCQQDAYVVWSNP